MVVDHHTKNVDGCLHVSVEIFLGVANEISRGIWQHQVYLL